MGRLIWEILFNMLIIHEYFVSILKGMVIKFVLITDYIICHRDHLKTQRRNPLKSLLLSFLPSDLKFIQY
jgi:hypothetical protein